MGNALSIAGWILLIVAVVARASWRTMICTLIIALLAEVAQHALAQFGRDNQWLGALHALDGMFVLLLAVLMSVTSIRRALPRR